MNNPLLQYRFLTGFDDASLSPAKWNELLPAGSSDVVFMTWHWQKIWWHTFGRGQLLLIVAEQEGRPVAIAPLFADYGRVYFVGSGGSDYLDFIGHIPDASVLEDMLRMAEQQVQDFGGFQFFHIPEESKTHLLLQEIANKKKWKIDAEGEWICPRLEFTEFPQQALAATRKKSLLRHEAWFQKNGELRIAHFHSAEDILPELDAFFEQHISRWAVTTSPSLFLDQKQKQFFKSLAGIAAVAGWLRFTKVSWNTQPVAFHFGFHYKQNFFWYKPTFAIDLARHSPGEVLLRNLLLQAQEENASVFDFGLGNEAFKDRFATGKKKVLNWGVYPINIEKEHEQDYRYQSAPRR